MTLLDRYIIKELIGPFVFGIAAFSCILAGSTVLFPLIGEAAKYGIPVSDLVKLFVYKMPSIIVYSFPMSTLLAAILAFSRLSADMEIMAFRASGIGFMRLLIPVFLFGLVISLSTILFNESIVPKATRSAENLMRSFTEGTKQPTMARHINFTQNDPNTNEPLRTVNIGEVKQGIMYNLTVAEYDSGKLARIIRAESGEWKPSQQWLFYHGIMHYFPIKDSKKITIIEFEKEIIDMDINPVDFTNRQKLIEEMTMGELKESIRFKAKTGQDPVKDIVFYHMKLAVPFASLIFSILGASVGLRPHRSSSAMGLGISLIVIFVYYILLSFGMGLGLAHAIPAAVAAWLPNLIVGSAAFYMMQRISQQ